MSFHFTILVNALTQEIRIITPICSFHPGFSACFANCIYNQRKKASYTSRISPNSFCSQWLSPKYSPSFILIKRSYWLCNLLVSREAASYISMLQRIKSIISVLRSYSKKKKRLYVGGSFSTHFLYTFKSVLKQKSVQFLWISYKLLMSMLRICYLVGTFKKQYSLKVNTYYYIDLIWINAMLMFKCLYFPSSYQSWQVIFIKDA